MVRELTVVAGGTGYEHEGLSSVVFLFWAALVTISILGAIVFSCADGASKDKSSHPTAAYASNCGAGCGTACGA